MAPRFRAVIDAFDAAKPTGYRESDGRSGNYRFYLPVTSPTGLHYEFIDNHDGTIGAEIHIEDDYYAGKAGLLQEFANR